MAANPSIQLGTDGNWAIKEDNLLAYKEDGTRFFNKQFDFTRGSLATFVDKNGLIKYSGVTDTELVTNGDFTTDSNWIPETNVTFSVSNGIANVFSTQAFRGIYQLSSVTAGKIYKGTITYKSDYDIRFYIGGSSFSLLSSSSDFITETVYINATGNSYIYILPTQINQTIQIDNVSVVEIQTDVPRIDFTDDATGHLLLEPSSTNLITYSEDFSQWFWGGNSNPNNTTRVDNQSSPDGGLNASLFTRNSGTSGWFSPQNITVSLNNTFTYSIFVKKNNSSTIELNNVSNSPQNKVVYNIDLNTFTTETNATGNSVNYGNGWYRISMTFEHTNSGGTSAQIRHILEEGKSMFVFGSQVEQLSYATSYIPTFGSTATRLADVCINSGSAQDFNSEEGVLYTEIAALADDGTGRNLGISDGTTSNRILILYSPNSNELRFYLAGSGGSITVNHTLTEVTEFIKVALKYKAQDFGFYVNGVEVDTNTSNITFSGLDDLSFNNPFGGGTSNFYGKTKDLKVFKRAMSDGELYLLTTTQYQSYQEMATALNYTL